MQVVHALWGMCVYNGSQLVSLHATEALAREAGLVASIESPELAPYWVDEWDVHGTET